MLWYESKFKKSDSYKINQAFPTPEFIKEMRFASIIDNKSQHKKFDFSWVKNYISREDDNN